MASDVMMAMSDDGSSSVMANEMVQLLIPEDKYEVKQKMEVKAEGEPRKFQDKEPMELIQYIEQFVTVTLLRNVYYDGFVHSIDPVSYSIILSVPKEEGKFKTIVIPGSAVENIHISLGDQSIKPPKRKQMNKISLADLQRKRNKLISWLKKNGLSVKVVENKIIEFAGVILIPPYEDKDICTSNLVVALEVKKLIAKMPTDFEP